MKASLIDVWLHHDSRYDGRALLHMSPVFVTLNGSSTHYKNYDLNAPSEVITPSGIITVCPGYGAHGNDHHGWIKLKPTHGPELCLVTFETMAAFAQPNGHAVLICPENGFPLVLANFTKAVPIHPDDQLPNYSLGAETPVPEPDTAAVFEVEVDMARRTISILPVSPA